MSKSDDADDGQTTRLEEEDPLQAADEQSKTQVLNTLLTDYETASEEARYRDRLLHQSYYLSIVVGGLIVNGILATVSNVDNSPLFTYGAVAALCGLGAASFILLLVYTASFVDSRHCAWARRKQIERYLRTHHPEALATNRSIVDRLVADDADIDGSLRRYRKFSAHKLTRRFLQALTVICLLGAAVSLRRFLQGLTVIFWGPLFPFCSP